ncbi:MAG: hypothetical protein QXD77_02185, partial [Candidatus Aenigmatarchaeota archaeon]
MDACRCPYSSEVTKGKKTLTFNCRDCQANASLTNPQCRAAVVEAQKLENADSVVLQKNFQRVHGRKDIETAVELAALSETAAKKLDEMFEYFCEKCHPAYKKLLRFVNNPVKFYYMLRAVKLCRACDHLAEPKLDELRRLMEKSPVIRHALKIGDVETA